MKNEKKMHVNLLNGLFKKIKCNYFCFIFQSHLLSLFDNVYRVTFDEKMYDKILQIHSQENETMELDTPVVCQVLCNVIRMIIYFIDSSTDTNQGNIIQSVSYTTI